MWGGSVVVFRVRGRRGDDGEHVIGMDGELLVHVGALLLGTVFERELELGGQGQEEAGDEDLCLLDCELCLLDGELRGFESIG
jgi:hypothetical protein